MSLIEGVLPVIPTPFVNGIFDKEGMERFLEHMLPWVDGYTLLGSTGEAPSLTSSQRMDIAAFCLEKTPRDKTVVVGVSHTSLDEAVALAKHAQGCGAKAVLCAAPYYFANTEPGMLRFLSALDAVLEVELVLYDNPVATDTLLDANAVIQWSHALNHLHNVKLTSPDLNKITVWHQAGLGVAAGDDPIAFRYLTGGVDAAMIIVPAIFPKAFAETWTLAREGRFVEAYEVFATRILPFTHVFGIGDEISTSKAMLQMMGIFASAEVLPPLMPATPERRALLMHAYELATGAKLEANTARE